MASELKSSVVIEARADGVERLVQLQETIDALGKTAQSITPNVDALQAQLANAAPDAAKLAEKLAELNDQNAQLQALVEAQKNAQKAAEEVSKLEDKLSSLRDELNRSQGYSAATARSVALSKAVADGSIQYKLASAALDRQNEALAQQMILAQRAGIDTSNLAGEQARLGAAAGQSAEQSKQASAVIEEAYATLGVKTIASVRGEIEKVKAAMEALRQQSGLTSNDIANGINAGRSKLQELNAELNKLQHPNFLPDAGKIANALNSARNAVGATGTFMRTQVANLREKFLDSAKDIAASFIESNVALDTLRNKLNVATRSAGDTEKQVAFLRETANRTGMDVGSLSDSFAGFVDSATKADVSMGTIDSTFGAVAEAGRRMGKSNSEVEQSFSKLSDMAKDGKVSMDGLEDVFGASLPGVLKTTAASLGMTEEELTKLAKSGELAADDKFYAAFAQAVNTNFNSGKSAVGGVTAEFNRLKNTWDDVATELGDAGIITALAGALKIAGGAVKDLWVELRFLFQGVGTSVASIVLSAEKLWNGEVRGAIAELGNGVSALGQSAVDTAPKLTSTYDAIVEVANGAEQTGDALDRSSGALGSHAQAAGAATHALGSVASASSAAGEAANKGAQAHAGLASHTEQVAAASAAAASHTALHAQAQSGTNQALGLGAAASRALALASTEATESANRHTAAQTANAASAQSNAQAQQQVKQALTESNKAEAESDAGFDKLRVQYDAKVLRLQEQIVVREKAVAKVREEVGALEKSAEASKKESDSSEKASAVKKEETAQTNKASAAKIDEATQSDKAAAAKRDEAAQVAQATEASKKAAEQSGKTAAAKNNEAGESAKLAKTGKDEGEQAKSIAQAKQAEGEQSKQLAKLKEDEYLQTSQIAKAKTELAAKQFLVVEGHWDEMTMLNKERTALQQYVAAHGGATRAQSEATKQLNALIETRRKASDAAQIELNLAELEAQNARLAASGYTFTAERLASLTSAKLQAAGAARKLSEEYSQGTATLEQANRAVNIANEAYKAYADGLHKATEAATAKVTEVKNQAAAIEKLNTLAKERVTGEISESTATGNTITLTQKKNELKSIELNTLHDKVMTMRQEAAAIDAAANTEEEELNKTHQMTQAKEIEISQRHDAADALRVEASATSDKVSQMQREISAIGQKDQAEQAAAANAKARAIGGNMYNKDGYWSDSEGKAISTTDGRVWEDWRSDELQQAAAKTGATAAAARAELQKRDAAAKAKAQKAKEDAKSRYLAGNGSESSLRAVGYSDLEIAQMRKDLADKMQQLVPYMGSTQNAESAAGAASLGGSADASGGQGSAQIASADRVWADWSDTELIKAAAGTGATAAAARAERQKRAEAAQKKAEEAKAAAKAAYLAGIGSESALRSVGFTAVEIAELMMQLANAKAKVQTASNSASVGTQNSGTTTADDNGSSTPARAAQAVPADSMAKAQSTVVTHAYTVNVSIGGQATPVNVSSEADAKALIAALQKAAMASAR